MCIRDSRESEGRRGEGQAFREALKQSRESFRGREIERPKSAGADGKKKGGKIGGERQQVRQENYNQNHNQNHNTEHRTEGEEIPREDTACLTSTRRCFRARPSASSSFKMPAFISAGIARCRPPRRSAIWREVTFTA